MRITRVALASSGEPSTGTMARQPASSSCQAIGSGGVHSPSRTEATNSAQGSSVTCPSGQPNHSPAAAWMATFLEQVLACLTIIVTPHSLACAAPLTARLPLPAVRVPASCYHAGMAEVVVVGGGPAGAAVAIHVARWGHAVLLLDRAAFP